MNTLPRTALDRGVAHTRDTLAVKVRKEVNVVEVCKISC